MPTFIPLNGLRVGRLVVISRADTEQNGGVRWRCSCDCGGETIVRSYSLRVGRIRSCGCLGQERARTNGFKNATHGHTRGGKSSEYRTWLNMRRRCEDHRRAVFKYYGGRGIKVCAEWSDFAAFLRDMGPRPFPKATIDRIDVNGHYEPHNCRWATWKQQQQNKRPRHAP